MKIIPNSIDSALENVAEKPTHFIGTLIQDALYLKFGNIHQNAEQRRLLDKYGLSELEKRIKENIQHIPLEHLMEPDFQTLMLSLDNVTPCLHSDILQDLFAQLIAHSCNKTYKDIVHPSFSEVIKQMSPLDAKIFDFFIKEKPEQIITYSHYNELRDCYSCVPYFFDTYPHPEDAIKVSVSISSLMRLGLIAFHDDAIVFDVEDSLFRHSDFYKDCERKRIESKKYANSGITGKMCVLTPFGNTFATACLS